MDHFQYIDDRLHVESVPLARIAEEYGTPCYVYSRATLERHSTHDSWAEPSREPGACGP